MTGSRRSLHKGLAALLALSLGGLVSLAIGEVAARAYFAALGASQPEPVGGGFGRYDDLLGYKPIPGKLVQVSHDEYRYRYRINQRGLRMDRDLPYERSPGNKRILLAGDSFTMGTGVSNRDRYGDRLEHLLVGTEIVNQGVSGWGTDQQFLFYQDDGVKYEPDVVVLCFMTSHIRRNAVASRGGGANGTVVPKPKFELQDGELVLTGVPVPPRRDPTAEERQRSVKQASLRSSGLPIPFKRQLRESSKLYRLLHTNLAGAAHALSWKQSNPFPEYSPDHPDWLLTRAIILEFGRAVRAEGGRFLLALGPTTDYVTRGNVRGRAHELLAGLGAEGGFPVVDLLPPMRAAAARGESVFFDTDAHWSGRGHAVVAQALAAAIEHNFGIARADESKLL